MLEIKVNETIHVVDTVGEAEEYIRKILDEFVRDSDKVQISITVIKRESIPAPPLGIHVSDKLDIKTVLG